MSIGPRGKGERGKKLKSSRPLRENLRDYGKWKPEHISDPGARETSRAGDVSQQHPVHPVIAVRNETPALSVRDYYRDAGRGGGPASIPFVRERSIQLHRK